LNADKVRADVLDKLDTLEAGDDVFIALTNGEKCRVRYGAHDDETITTYRTALRESETTAYQLSEVVHVERVDISIMKTMGIGALGIIGLMAITLLSESTYR
jgi:hypothetical protein